MAINHLRKHYKLKQLNIIFGLICRCTHVHCTGLNHIYIYLLYQYLWKLYLYLIYITSDIYWWFLFLLNIYIYQNTYNISVQYILLWAMIRFMIKNCIHFDNRLSKPPCIYAQEKQSVRVQFKHLDHVDVNSTSRLYENYWLYIILSRFYKQYHIQILC